MKLTMKFNWILATAVVALTVQMAPSAQAFECPLHFAEAQAAIEQTAENTQGMESKMPKEDVALVLAHLGNARMSLVEAKYHHTQSNGYHHARAIVRANEARGYAVAADRLHQNMMNK